MENEVVLSLKVLVEKEKNQVVFVESNQDFVDVLCSFMTMPIGKIIKLIREHSLLSGGIGCLNNLYESVGNLDEEFLQSRKCRDILLCPRSAAEIYCRNLKLNLIECDGNQYYVCSGSTCGFVSYYQTAHCRCGNGLELEVKLGNPLSTQPQEGGVFFKSTSQFMISDDFQLLPMSTITGLSLLSKLGATDGSTIEERTVNIGRDEVLNLLKCSLTSRTPFSDTFLQRPISKTSYRICRGVFGPSRMDQCQKFMDTAKKETKICFKIIVNKSKNRALYAEVGNDFVDLLCSFLAFPIGYVFEAFPSLSFKGCTANLYKSICDTEVKFFNSEEMKETLVNPKLAPGLAYDNQLIGIEEALYPSYSTLSSLFKAKCVSMPLLEESKVSGGLIKGMSMFMVMDNLTVTPLSPIAGISLINRLKIPFSDIREQKVTMGEDEALRLLVASLVSKCVLTDAFLLKEPKQEQ